MYPDDLKGEPLGEFGGLFLMTALVSQGARFWSDTLKGAGS